MDIRIIRHFHLFAGLGGGAKGFNSANVRVGQMQALFRCIGGVDVDPAGIADFERLTGVPGAVLDMFDRDQYRAFHGHEPPQDWREAGPDDIRRAAGGEFPHIVFLSAPCKGFSGLLAEARSTTERYQALNRLTVRGVWLMLEAFKDDLPELVVFENVPRIMQRGRKLLDLIVKLLRAYGYLTAETTHDCGEIGGLAQSRKRFLLVARHGQKVPPFLYEPPKRALRAVGEVLDRMPLPGDGAAGPMHRVASLQWRTWVRLAFVEAGSDWRSLQRLRVEDGMLADYRLLPAREPFKGSFGVLRWEDTAGAVSSAGQHDNGRWSVADPRLPEPDERLVALIVAEDGTWHRPFTTLELAALQGLVEPEEKLELDGLSDAAWRERIGNAVPPPAARGIAETMGRTLLLAWSGEGFALSNVPIWVRDVAVALSVDAAP